jgi:hypothetical protein
MAKSLDRTAFLTEPTRLQIAELCLEEALTDEEIAASLGRPLGSLSQPRTMRTHKALIRGKKRNAADGRGAKETSRFNPAPAWAEALQEARRRQRPAWPDDPRDLLLISLNETPNACAAIAAGIPEIEWGAQLGGERTGLLVAPQVDMDGANTIRVVSKLGPAVSVVRLQLNEVMSPNELRAWAARSMPAPGSTGELPPRS